MKRRIVSILMACALLFALAGTAMASSTGGNVAAGSRNGVARVATFVTAELYTVENGRLAERIDGVENVLGGTGTAFGVGTAGQPTDIFVTNNHVISDSVSVLQTDEEGNPIIVLSQTVTAVYILLDNFAYSKDTGLDPSRAVPCNIICSQDESGADIAILKAAEPVQGRIALPLQDDESGLDIGDNVTALGYPGASDAATTEGAKLAEVGDVTVTTGTVARFYDPVSVSGNIGELENSRYIQHTAVVNHGNSGGPLIDGNGAVVGVNTIIYQSSAYAESTAFYSLRIQYVKDALDALGIHYDVYRSGPSPLLLAVVGGAAAVVVAVVILAVVLGRRKKPEPGPVPGPTPEPGPAPAQELRIQGQSGVFAGRRFSINGQVRIGRDPGGNDLVYPDGTPGISGRHCVVALAGGQVTLTDLGSSYGTFLAGGQKLTPNQPVTLRMGDSFYLGSEKERFAITGKGGSLT